MRGDARSVTRVARVRVARRRRARPRVETAATLLLTSTSRQAGSTMPTFSRNPLNEAEYSKLFRRYPALFGVPFVLLIVGASFGMQQFTQTRYDLHAQRVTAVRILTGLLLLE